MTNLAITREHVPPSATGPFLATEFGKQMFARTANEGIAIEKRIQDNYSEGLLERLAYVSTFT